MIRLKLLVGAASVVLLAAACGGGGGDGPTETQMQREDRNASMSVAGLIAFAKAQIAQATSETAEPRAIDAITLPTSESDEPRPL